MSRVLDLILQEIALEESGLPERVYIAEQKQAMFKPAGVRTINGVGPNGQGDVTVSGTGGSSGNSRVITSVSSPTTAAAAATTDYVYLVSGTTTLTLPTAVGNKNLYTVKNVGSNTVTIATTSGQTIDGSSTAPMPVGNESLDLVSDNSNWKVI